MKLLIVSDSHGYDNKLLDIILENKDVNTIVYLGDGERDLDVAVNAANFVDGVLQVAGNCDRASMEPLNRTAKFGDVKIYITHGAQENVKYGIWGLLDAAKKEDCRVALFGHTHRQTLIEKDGVTLFNPGTVSRGEYGLLTIDNGKIAFEHKKI